MFSTFVVWYLFLAGTAAGSFLVATVENAPFDNDVLRKPSVSNLKPAGSGFFIAAVAYPLACVFLLCDLGNPQKILQIVINPFVSMVSIGAWIVGLAAVVACLTAFLILMDRLTMVRIIVCEVLGSLLSIGALLYTGILLSTMPSVDLWRTAWLVVLFFVSGITCGIAATNLMRFALHGSLHHAFSLETAQMVSTVVEAAVLIAFLLTGYFASADGQASVLRLLAGEGSALFLGIVVVLGVGGGTVLRAMRDIVRGAGPVLAAAVCALLAGFCLRYCIVDAAIVSELAFGPLYV